MQVSYFFGIIIMSIESYKVSESPTFVKFKNFSKESRMISMNSHSFKSS